jgi:DNA replication protein DnaC
MEHDAAANDVALELEQACPHCEGQGMRIVEGPGGRRSAVACVCRVSRIRDSRLLKAGIPKQYRHSTLDSFDTQYPERNESLLRARLAAQRIVDSYPLENQGVGLMLTGGAGRGKTHLAVGILLGLIEKGADGYFCEYIDLLRRIQHSYGSDQAQFNEFSLLAPLFNMEVLVLDELGATKPTDWVYDTLSLILNKRYNDRKLTIITTNYPNLPPAKSDFDSPEPKLVDRFQNEAKEDAKDVMRGRTLGDRIGERMWSRLQEMCVSVELKGNDFRSGVKKASLY